MILNINFRTWKSCMVLHTDLLVLKIPKQLKFKENVVVYEDYHDNIALLANSVATCYECCL